MTAMLYKKTNPREAPSTGPQRPWPMKSGENGFEGQKIGSEKKSENGGAARRSRHSQTKKKDGSSRVTVPKRNAKGAPKFFEKKIPTSPLGPPVPG